MNSTLSSENIGNREWLKHKILADINNTSDLSATDSDELSNFSTPLIIESMDYDIRDRQAHVVDKYELMDKTQPTLVFRRGQPFTIYLTLNRLYNRGQDEIYLNISYGPSSSTSRGTLFHVPLTQFEDEDRDKWSMWTYSTDGNVISVKVRAPRKCPVGLWRYTVAPKMLNVQQFSPNITYILFNPWCEDDDVFVEDARHRELYLLNDHDHIYNGTGDDPKSTLWVYGQFDYVVLPALALLMEHSDLPYSDRGSPVLVTRALSAIMNSMDNDGLIYGKWGADYDGGTQAEAWTGSTAIFEQFLNSGGRSVRYGQCWVFAGCLTTACRALGIPCRTITCYNAAHDASNTLTVNRYYSEKNDEIADPRGVTDSIWNFHCWNEAWMKRPDLPPGYDGWQALDATPQERSQGKFQMGPAPVKGVLAGEIGLGYDTNFVYAEVNADICYFVRDSSSPWDFTLFQLDTTMIGKRIVTDLNLGMKNVPNMLDITDNYKCKEETPEERESFYKAIKQNAEASKFYRNFLPIDGDSVGVDNPQDVSFKLNKCTSIAFGSSFDLTVSIQNHSDRRRTVEVNFECHLVLHTSTNVDTIMERQTKYVVINRKEGQTVNLLVKPKDYEHKLHNSNIVKVNVSCLVQETRQMYHGENVFEIDHPQLIVKVDPSVKIGVVNVTKFMFHNGFNRELTQCRLTIEGPGLLRPKTFELSNIPAFGDTVRIVRILPSRKGPCLLVGILTCKELPNIQGSAMLQVVEKDDENITYSY